MSTTNDKAEEILNRSQTSKTSQHWSHSNLDDEEAFGAHWNSNSRRRKQTSKNFDEGSSGDYQSGKNKIAHISTGSKDRPRSKNRRPDAAVYVPRARRLQESSQPDVGDVKDAGESSSGNIEERSRPRRNKAGAEIYVPRPKRLQQSSETEQGKGDLLAEERLNSSETPESDTSKESKKAKHKTKVSRVNGAECDTLNDPDNKGPRKKDRSKRGTRDKEMLKEKSIKHKRKLKETADDSVLDPENSEDNFAVENNETWEEEMKFYDSMSSDQLKPSEKVEERFERDECLEETATGADCQDSSHARLKETGADVIHDSATCNFSDPVGTFANVGVPKNTEAVEIETEIKVDISNKHEGDLSDVPEQPMKRRKSSDELVNTDDICDNDMPEENTLEADVKCNDASETVISDIRESMLDSDSQISNSDGTGVTESKVKEDSIQTEMTSSKVACANEDVENSEEVDATKLPGPHVSDQIGSKQITEEVQTPKISADNEASDSGNAAWDNEEDSDTWDALFDDDGEALDPKLMDELTAAVGKVKVQKTQFDYYNYQPKDPDLDDDAYGHLIEIYDFPTELITRDLLAAFREYKDRGFDIKWVDDNHAIGIFSSSIAAQAVLGMKHPLMKVRPISQASKQTKVKAKKCAVFMEPYRPRPETTAAVARSLVTGALGLKSSLTREQRDEERKKLREAKEKRRQERQQKKDAWDGAYGKCAMDM